MTGHEASALAAPLVAALLAALAGGVGAALRLLLDGAVTLWCARRGARPALPWGILAVNLSGSFAFGVLTGALLGGAVTGEAWTVVSVGLLGGYTTFSTASFDTVRLLREGRWALAAGYAFGQLAATALAAWLGVWCAYALATG